MLKTVFTTAIAALSLAGVSLPAQAATIAAGACDDIDYSVHDNANSITAQLEAQGLTVTGVDEWSNCVRAFVVHADGSTGMAFFDPLTLEAVGDGAGV